MLGGDGTAAAVRLGRRRSTSLSTGNHGRVRLAKLGEPQQQGNRGDSVSTRQRQRGVAAERSASPSQTEDEEGTRGENPLLRASTGAKFENAIARVASMLADHSVALTEKAAAKGTRGGTSVDPGEQLTEREASRAGYDSAEDSAADGDDSVDDDDEFGEFEHRSGSRRRHSENKLKELNADEPLFELRDSTVNREHHRHRSSQQQRRPQPHERAQSAFAGSRRRAHGHGASKGGGSSSSSPPTSSPDAPSAADTVGARRKPPPAQRRLMAEDGGYDGFGWSGQGSNPSKSQAHLQDEQGLSGFTRRRPSTAGPGLLRRQNVAY
eukprot:COSAG05_NODE_364_length_10775_cov_3.222836_8_plen_324_part_00